MTSERVAPPPLRLTIDLRERLADHCLQRVALHITILLPYIVLGWRFCCAIQLLRELTRVHISSLTRAQKYKANSMCN
jgi:hypothetical protein